MYTVRRTGTKPTLFIAMSINQGYNGSSASGSESTASSLRPRSSGQVRPVRNIAGKYGNTNASMSQRYGGNALDRLSDHVLNWNIMDDLSRNICPRSPDWLREQTTAETVVILPDVYESYNTYVDAWEPLMIKEVQDSIVSKFTTLLSTAVSGTFHCTVASDRDTDTATVHLEVTFNLDQRIRDSNRRFAGTMDLIMISLAAFKMPTADRNNAAPSVQNNPYSAESIASFTKQKYVLGLLVSSSNGNNGPRTHQVLVSKRKWNDFKEHFEDSHVSSFKSTPQANSSYARSSNAAVGKIKSYKLHYVVIDSLRSQWREFHALHDLGFNIPLMAEILGGNRSFDMAATPPYDGPGDAEEEGNPFSVSSTQQQQQLHAPVVNASQLVLSSSSLLVPSFGTLSRQTSNGTDDAASSENRSETRTHSAQTKGTRSTVGMLHRLEVIEQVINSWKMKGCTEKFMRYLRLKYNPSQLHAIHTAVDQQGFTLVQGPPGTGKTSTIIGILNAIHIREYNQYYKLALEALLGPEGQQCRLQPYEHPWLKLVARLTLSKPRILVVAPSNTAVDNIILRIMESGFVDGNGGKYYPNILRAGVGSKSPKIRSVTLEELVDKELAQPDASTNRRDSIDTLSTHITEMIKQIAFLQSMLVNLTLAFSQSQPLPESVELRVDRTSGRPQWVDHHLRAASHTAPDRKLVQTRGVSREYTTLETLPDYIAYSHQLTQLLGAVENAHSKRSKLHALDTMTAELGRMHTRDLAERTLIDGAHILFTTLNGAGHPSLEATEFCVTVVDEAAQSVEPSVLIALRRGCRQCIMVGDQQQLTATTFSPQARAAQYDRSLFQRLIETGHPYIMLDTQYRMCGEISEFPARVFYKGQLKNGANVCAPTYLPPYLISPSSRTATQPIPSEALLAPFMFFNLESSQERLGPSGSQSNLPEAQFCMSLIQTLLNAGRQAKCATLGTIGVITFYGDQLQLLRSNLCKHNFPIREPGAAPQPGLCAIEDLELNTVDGFQGKETDIIIISAVRANDQRIIGFLSDVRRMNVGFTRARKALFIVGHAPTLRSNRTWRELIDHATEQDVFVSVQDREDPMHALRARYYPKEQQARSNPPVDSFAAVLQNYGTTAPTKQQVRTHYKDRDYSKPLPQGSSIVVSENAVGWVNAALPRASASVGETSNEPQQPVVARNAPPPPPPLLKKGAVPGRPPLVVGQPHNAVNPNMAPPPPISAPVVVGSKNLNPAPFPQEQSGASHRFTRPPPPPQPLPTVLAPAPAPAPAPNMGSARGLNQSASGSSRGPVGISGPAINEIIRHKRKIAELEELEEGEVLDLT